MKKIDGIEYLKKQINNMQIKHQNDELYYYDRFKNDPNPYDWTMPPEFNPILNGAKGIQWGKSSDIFYLMMDFYQYVVGERPSVNFQLNDLSIQKLISCLELDNQSADSLKQLFKKSTQIVQSKRFSNVQELSDSQEYKNLTLNR